MSSEKKRETSDDKLEKQIAEVVKIGAPLATVVLAILAGAFVDVATAILILAAGALVGVIAMFWSSLRTLLGETALSGADAYAIGAPPRAEEEQKRAVLRALKDLEFERSVGKISEEDYRGLVAKYRAEAKRLLQLIDEEAAPGRERAEVLVNRRLQKEGLLDAEDEAKTSLEDEDEDDDLEAPEAREAREASEDNEAPTDEADDEDEEATEDKPAPVSEKPAVVVEKPAPKKKAKKKSKKPERATIACASCSTTNDEDALFCKKCGASMKAAEAAVEGAKTDEEAS